MTDTKDISLDDLTVFLAGSNAPVYGFVVSQQVYDGLRARVPAKFAGGNCFGSTPIVVDPELSGADMEVAFTKDAWTKRLKEIRS